MVTADAMKKALSEGLEKSTGNNTDPISKEIINYHLLLIVQLALVTYYEFIYLPEIGTHVLKNHELVELIQGLNLKKHSLESFFQIIQSKKTLKKAMLGG